MPVIAASPPDAPQPLIFAKSAPQVASSSSTVVWVLRFIMLRLVSPGGCLKLVKTMMYSLPTRQHDRRTIRDQQWLACSIRLQAGCAQGETGLLFDDETCSTDLYHPSTDLRRTSCAVHEHRHGGVCCNIPRRSLSAVESDTGIESQPEESDACGMLV